MIIRLARRTEEMDSGSAFSAGPKVEVRGWVKKHVQATESGAVAGKTWYPPSLPIVGLVADTTAGYSEVGVVFGLNVSDFIPGSTFINTVNNFTETEKTFRFMKEPPLTLIATKIREAREKRRLLNSTTLPDQMKLTASMKKAFCKRSLEHSNQNEMMQTQSKRAIGF
jgi:hypothetical protein